MKTIPMLSAALCALVISAAQGQPPAPPGGDSETKPTQAVLLQNGGTDAKASQTIIASEQDQSGVLVTGGGTLTLRDSTVTTSGNTSSPDSSSFLGLNAAVVANSGSTMHLSGSTVTTSGTGANGVFASGQGTSIDLNNVKIQCTGQLGHGVDATEGGKLTLSNVTIETAGANAAALATDRGGGTLEVNAGTMKTSGADAPGIYSTGNITVTAAQIAATGSEAAVIEGSNSIRLTDTHLSGALKRGVMIYQSMSGDAPGVQGNFDMKGGTLTASEGPAFYITNTTGIIQLKGVEISTPSGVLLEAGAGQWGTAGSNGGTVHLNASDQSLTGSVVLDGLSSLTASFSEGSTLTGAVNSAKAARSVELTFDASSTWTLTGDSHVNALTGALISGEAVTNITGNGHNLYYERANAANSSLGGRTYSLVNGGQLIAE